jgi:hypothetical protein
MEIETEAQFWSELVGELRKLNGLLPLVFAERQMGDRLADEAPAATAPSSEAPEKGGDHGGA